MKPSAPSRLDLILAGVCRNCPVCRRARARQTGVAFRLVQRVERGLCPFCRAYQRVYGLEPHRAIRSAGQDLP